MNQKPSPLSKLTGITPEQAEELLEVLRPGAYRVGVEWVEKNLGLKVSISGLRRWWRAETARRSRADLSGAIKASAKFDAKVDKRVLDTRAANAIRAKFWDALVNRDHESIETFGKLVLDYNADDRDSEKLQRMLKAEQDLKAAQEQLAEQAAQIEALRQQLAEAGKVTLADPSAVSNELDRLLGVKK
jgi:hypothetical protein